jgi:hypothetical protein
MRSSLGPVGWLVPVLPGVCDMGACVCSKGLQPSVVAFGGCLVFFLVARGFLFTGRLVLGCFPLSGCRLG